MYSNTTLEFGCWKPIETHPQDGTLVLVGNSEGVWVAKYSEKHPSGHKRWMPWVDMTLNKDHIGRRYPDDHPTHWMPLPENPIDV